MREKFKIISDNIIGRYSEIKVIKIELKFEEYYNFTIRREAVI